MTTPLQEAVQKLHKCKSTFREIVHVAERFEGQMAWKGDVHVFDLKDHPTASRCYAWSSAIEGSKKRRFYVVLQVPPVTSPVEAVRASIVQDYKKENP